MGYSPLVLDIPQAGEYYTNPQLVFDSNLVPDTTGCTLSDQNQYVWEIGNDGPGGKVACPEIFDKNIRLTGSRYLNIHWHSDVDNASFSIKLGKHTWRVKGGVAGEQNSLIDMCRPDSSELTAGSANLIETVDLVLETAHNIGETVSLEIPDGSIPEGADKVRLHFEKIAGDVLLPYFQLDILDENNNGIHNLISYNVNGYSTPWFDVATHKPKTVVFTPFGGNNNYGFKMDSILVQGVGVTEAQQSIIPFEMPQDKRQYSAETGTTRHPDEETAYSWDFPVGWGIGRLTNLEIHLDTEATYTFYECKNYRKSIADGGFAKLYVLPQSCPWNDTREFDDYCWHDSGTQVFETHTNNIKIIPKAYLVIDGAVVFEIPLAVCIENNSPAGFWKNENETVIPFYEWWYYCLSDDAIGYPVCDYTNYAVKKNQANGHLSQYDVNGLTVHPNARCSAIGDFWAEHCLTGYLKGGVYLPSEQDELTKREMIKVPLRIEPRYWNTYPDTSCLPNQAYKRFRGQIQGLIWNGNKSQRSLQNVTVSSPHGDVGAQEITQVQTNELGWYESKAMNTKGPFELEASDITARSVPVRSRFISRLNAIAKTKVLRHCDSGKIKIGPTGKPALECSC